MTTKCVASMPAVAAGSIWMWAPPAVALLFAIVIVLTGINASAFLWLNRFGHFAGELWWVNLTILGDGAIALVLILPMIKRSPQRFWAALLAAIVTAIVVQVWKHAIDTPRPLAIFPEGTFFHTGPKFRAASSPSGHAAAIFTLAGVWIMRLQGHAVFKSTLLLLAVLVSLSRIMVGVHWPLDIIAGMLIGWLSASIGLHLTARPVWQSAGTASCIAGIVLVTIAGSLLVSNHIGYPAAVPLQRLIGIGCLAWAARELFGMGADRWQKRTGVLRSTLGKTRQ